MKTFRILALAIAWGISAISMTSIAQTTELTVVIKGIKEAKGKLMIAVGDIKNPREMISEMIVVENTDDIVCVLKNVPAGKINLYIYQDINENFQLDKDEDQIPIEPCYYKEKITIKADEDKIEAKLINVKELISENWITLPFKLFLELTYSGSSRLYSTNAG